AAYRSQWRHDRVSGLSRLGASISVKDRQMQSPLHFAAHFGRYNTVKRLLESDCGVNIINDSDNHGFTALHLAADNGHAKVVQLLMTKGALIHRDHEGRTPLHLAAAANYHETINVIVVHYAHLVDSVDKQGNTALHLAASHNSSRAVAYLLTAGASLTVNHLHQRASDVAIQRKHQETMLTMVAHKRWEEILSQQSSLYGWPILGLIEHLPEVMTAVLDRSLIRAPCHPLSKDYFIHFDFKLLEPKEKLKFSDEELSKSESLQDPDEPLLPFNYMVRHKRCKLLSHPVCSSFLNKKWACYGIYYHGLNVTLYTIYLALLTFLICDEVKQSLVPSLKQESYTRLKEYNQFKDDSSTAPECVNGMTEDSEENSPNSGMVLLVLVFTASEWAGSSCRCFSGNRDTSRVPITIWNGIVSVCHIFAIGTYDVAEHFISWDLRWQMGACAVFIRLVQPYALFAKIWLAWLSTSLCLYYFPDNAEYYMKSGFVVDLDSLRTPHLNMWTSILRISSMMVGDFDMIHNYLLPMTDTAMPFPLLTYIFLIMFIHTSPSSS
ncbi:Transient receptor potential cation channel subfamily A member 1, partial [Hypsibius exemplaris]